MRAGCAVMAVAALAAGCASLPHPNPADAARAAATWPGATVASLEADRSRYAAKCSSCHALRKPARYRPERWTRYLDKMGDRAKLTDEDRAAIERYVVTMAGAGR